MIKNLIFDLGNVIVDYDPSRIVQAIFPDKEEQKIIYKEIFCSHGWKQLDRGVLTFEEHTQNLILQFPQYAREIKWILNNWHRDLPYIPGMFSVIKALKAADYDLYVLSNASQRYLKYALSKKEFFSNFSGVTISAELRLLKPEGEIYDQFCQIHNLKPKECLFIDDKAENVQAAIDAGWEAYQFKNPIDLINYLESTLSIKLSKTNIPQKQT
jgi:putative hydrolase of the HAD superfamily